MYLLLLLNSSEHKRRHFHMHPLLEVELLLLLLLVLVLLLERVVLLRLFLSSKLTLLFLAHQHLLHHLLFQQLLVALNQLHCRRRAIASEACNQPVRPHSRNNNISSSRLQSEDQYQEKDPSHLHLLSLLLEVEVEEAEEAGNGSQCRQHHPSRHRLNHQTR